MAAANADTDLSLLLTTDKKQRRKKKCLRFLEATTNYAQLVHIGWDQEKQSHPATKLQTAKDTENAPSQMARIKTLNG